MLHVRTEAASTEAAATPTPAGTVLTRPGVIMAGSDRFALNITGVGGHGAIPHEAVDPVLAASAVVLALQVGPCFSFLAT